MYLQTGQPLALKAQDRKRACSEGVKATSTSRLPSHSHPTESLAIASICLSFLFLLLQEQLRHLLRELPPKARPTARQQLQQRPLRTARLILRPLQHLQKHRLVVVMFPQTPVQTPARLQPLRVPLRRLWILQSLVPLQHQQMAQRKHQPLKIR